MLQSATVWNPNARVLAIYDAARSIAAITGTLESGQTVIRIDSFQGFNIAGYLPNRHAIMVFIDGAFKTSGIDYTEVDEFTIQLSSPATGGERATLLVFTEIKDYKQDVEAYVLELQEYARQARSDSKIIADTKATAVALLNYLDATNDQVDAWAGGDENYEGWIRGRLVRSPAKMIKDNEEIIQAQAPSLGQLVLPTGAGLIGFKQNGNGSIYQTVQDKLNLTVHVKDFGAVCDGVADDWAAIQLAIDSIAAGTTLIFGKSKISEALYISKPINLKFNGVGATLEQVTWGKPHIIVYQTPDVTISGDVYLIYNGVRTLLSNKPTSTDSRIDAIYSGTDIGSVRTLAAGVYLYRQCDNFKADRLFIKGQVVGLIHAALNVYASYSDNNYIQELNVDTVDFGYLSGGFKRLTFGSVNAKNITTTQGDPSHAVYVGPRTVRNGILSIKTLNVDGCQNIVDASDSIHASDAFSIRWCDLVTIGEIQVRNSQYLGNFQEGRFIVGSINAVLGDITSGTLADELAVPFNVQSGADVTISNWKVESGLGWIAGKQPSYFMNVSSAAKLRILNGYHRATALKPGNIGRLSSSGKLLNVSKFIMEFDNEFDAGYTNPAAFISTALFGNGSFVLDDPYLQGSQYLFNAPISGVDWKIFLNPSKISNNTSSCIIDAGGAYHINFLSWPDVGTLVPAWTGEQAIQTRSRRVLLVNNTSSAAIGACHSGGSPNQDFLINCTDNVTSIRNNSNIVLKPVWNGTTFVSQDIAPGWKWFLYRVVGSVAYEIAHG